MIDYKHPDLTQHPPRSARVRLGGFVHLPRLLDKARAFAAGKNGDFNYDCGLDKRFFTFTGLDAQDFLFEVKTGKSDTQMLAWVMDNASPKRVLHEIVQWSAWLENLSPGGAPGHEYLAESIKKHGPDRTDIRTTFDNLDLDDYVSFGGAG